MSICLASSDTLPAVCCSPFTRNCFSASSLAFFFTSLSDNSVTGATPSSFDAADTHAHLRLLEARLLHSLSRERRSILLALLGCAASLSAMLCPPTSPHTSLPFSLPTSLPLPHALRVISLLLAIALLLPSLLREKSKRPLEEECKWKQRRVSLGLERR
ncbi:MAG: hypothetical protein SGPRY_014831, partial [Prymnesium sp.]